MYQEQSLDFKAKKGGQSWENRFRKPDNPPKIGCSNDGDSSSMSPEQQDLWKTLQLKFEKGSSVKIGEPSVKESFFNHTVTIPYFVNGKSYTIIVKIGFFGNVKRIGKVFAFFWINGINIGNVSSIFYFVFLKYIRNILILRSFF